MAYNFGQFLSSNITDYLTKIPEKTLSAPNRVWNKRFNYHRRNFYLYG